jgi:arylsulfatase A-like enzyme
VLSPAVPTLAELLGHPRPPHLQGASLRTLLEDGDAAPDEAEVVVEWNGPFRIQHLEELRARGHLAGIDRDDPRLSAVRSRTIRRGRWKLTVHASGEHELYDLRADPGELHNAFWDSAVGDVIAWLADRLRRWQREAGDDVVIPDVMR